MPRRRITPTTALGAAIQARRGSSTLREVAPLIGVGWHVLARLERGGGVRREATRAALAVWLGWTVERVRALAEEAR